MRFENVCIESLAVALPEEVWTSAEIEERLRPLYERLKLSAGRLELMSGIRERRVWPAGTRASDASAAAGRAVLAKSNLPSSDVELFIHAAGFPIPSSPGADARRGRTAGSAPATCAWSSARHSGATSTFSNFGGQLSTTW